MRNYVYIYIHIYPQIGLYSFIYKPIKEKVLHFIYILIMYSKINDVTY